MSLIRTAALVPAYQVAPVVGDVVHQLMRVWPDPEAVLVIDDGSTDGTGEVARRAGATVIRHRVNEGKGTAIRTGLRAAAARGYALAMTIDGDGQHPPHEALRIHEACHDPDALLIGVRDLEGAGAPRANQLSNRFSNLVLSGFAGKTLRDTQCGLRRYPIARTLALGGVEAGYGYEAEILLRAVAAKVPIVELPIEVIYPPEDQRISHFDAVKDPARIVSRVLRTVAATRWGLGER